MDYGLWADVIGGTFFVIADLMGDDAEQVVGVGMVRIEPEHPPVGGLGVRQLPGLVRPQPLL